MGTSSRWKLPFFTVWTGQALSLFGSFLVRFAIIWWLTEESGSAGGRTRLADAMAGAMPAPDAPEYRDILELISDHHSDAAKRAAAKKALGG